MNDSKCNANYLNGNCMWSKIECKFCGKVITKIAQYYEDRMLSTGCCSKKCYKSWELKDSYKTLVKREVRLYTLLSLLDILEVSDDDFPTFMFLTEKVMLEMKKNG